MKFKKIILTTMLIITIISVDSKCYAKYIFEYSKKAVEIDINN